MAVFGQRVFQMVTHHRPVCLFAVFLHVPEERADLLKRLAAIEIVCVDDDKRRINVVACRQNGVARAPRLLAAFRHRKALRQVIQLLENIFDLHVLRYAVADNLFKVLKKLLLDNEDYLGKARLYGIKNRKIHDNLAVFANGIDLLQAAVTAAHTGRHND